MSRLNPTRVFRATDRIILWTMFKFLRFVRRGSGRKLIPSKVGGGLRLVFPGFLRPNFALRRAFQGTDVPSETSRNRKRSRHLGKVSKTCKDMSKKCTDD
jgi:hypothetical protein